MQFQREWGHLFKMHHVDSGLSAAAAYARLMIRTKGLEVWLMPCSFDLKQLHNQTYSDAAAVLDALDAAIQDAEDAKM